jgi:Zn-dependent protease
VALSQQSSVRLFRFSGIDVFLHWSWFVIAVFEINARNGRYTSFAWNVAEYLSLFAIVLLHEFGHALVSPMWIRRLAQALPCGASPPGRW